MSDFLTAQLLADTGVSTRDRITSIPSLSISGVRPGAQYEISTDFGKTWGRKVTAPPVRGKALQFDGQNDFVSLPDSSSLPTGNGSYTLEAWIKPDAMGDRGIIGWGPWGSQSQVNALRLMGDGQIRHYWWGNDLDVNVGNLADGKWHHVAATFDGQTRRVYVDGVLKGSDVPPTHRLPVVAKNIRIGSTNNGEFFKGGIDDAAIWSRSLTQQEITQRLTTAPNVGDKSLVVFYNFEEGAGNSASARGAAANGMTGTLTNGPTWTTRDIASSGDGASVAVEINIPDGQYADGQVMFRELSAQNTGIQVVSQVKKWWSMHEIIVFNGQLDNTQGILSSTIQEETSPGTWTTRHVLTKEQISIGENALPANSIDWQKNVRIISTYEDKSGSIHTSIQAWDAGVVIANGNKYVPPRSSQSSLPARALQVDAFKVDTQAPTIRLDLPGGSDRIISSEQNDAIISGTADPSRNLALFSKLGSVAAGNLKMTSDNGADIYLNGQLVGSTSDWTKPYDFTGLKVQAGQNVLAILAYDVGGIAGLSGRFEVPSGTFGTSNLSGWKVLNVDSDPTTDNSTASRDRNQWKLPADWASVNFDDRSWSSAINVQAKTGQYPWGNRTGDPAWIWSEDPYNHDAVLFRYTFTGTSDDVGQVVLADNVQVAADGTFSYQLTADQLKQLGEGAGKTLVALQTDEAGNSGRSSQVTFAVDTVAAPVTITSIGGGDGKVSSEVVETGKGPLKLQVDQYTGYWSSKLGDLQNYVKNYNPVTQKNRYSVVTDVVDFTDDKGGFAGELPFDRRWPAAEATNYWGTGGVNNLFFAKVSGDFHLDQPGQYRFRTFNDDGVFLLIDGKLVINDPTLHPEQVFTGDASLASGNHQLELFFFENGGEASLEFSVSRFDTAKNAWGPYQLMGKDQAFQAKSLLQPDNQVIGQAAPNSTVFLRIGDQVLGSAPTDVTGAFSYSLTNENLALLAKGIENGGLVAYQRDAAGNLSTSAPTPLELKQKPPAVTIESVGLQDQIVSTLSADNEIIGRGEANLLTTIRVGDVVLGQVQASADGRFRYAFNSENINRIGQGSSKTVVASQSLPSGVKGESSPFIFGVDTFAPTVAITSIGYGDSRMSRNRAELGKGALEFQVDQYTGYWSKSLSDLRGYVAKYNPVTQSSKYSIVSSVIDFTDDQTGFAGELPYDMRWPAAVATNTWGTGGINNQFFVRIASDFSVEQAGAYRFRTYNDDGVFLLVDGALVINDPTEHPEAIFTGDINLSAGNHSLELFFFENGGEASLEFSASYFDPAVGQWSPYQIVGRQDLIKARSNLQPDNLIEGIADPLREVAVYLESAELGRVRADQQGRFALNLSPQALEMLDSASQSGPVNIHSVQIDAVGNVGVSDPALASVKLRAPVIVADALGGVDRVVSSQGTDRVISGTAESGSELTLAINGKVFATVADIAADGRFSYALTDADITRIAQGASKSLQLRQQDLYGNVGSFTSALFSVDTIAPQLKLPAIKDASSLGGADGIISSKASDAVLSGAGEANTAVSVRFGTIQRSVLANAEGRFVYNLNALDIDALGQGEGREISVSQSDAAGNVAMQTLKVDVDTIAPDQPVMKSLAGDGFVSGQLNDNILSGKADANALVTLLLNGSTLAAVKADSKGQFSYAMSAADVASFGQGSLRFQASLSDLAGNIATSDSVDLVVDTIAPSQPTLSSIGGDDLIISSKDRKILGQAEARSTVSFYGASRLLGVATANDSGEFEFSLTAANITALGQGSGRQVTAVASDMAGNVSAVSNPFVFAVDTVAPGSPVFSSLGGQDGVISSQAGDAMIYGLGEAGSVVQLRGIDNRGGLFNVSGITVDRTGRWTYALTTEQVGLLNSAQQGGRAPSVTAFTTDQAGNESPSLSVIPNVDLRAPDLRDHQLGGGDRIVSTLVGDNLITGKGEANRSVTIAVGGRALATVVADRDGLFAYSLTSANLTSIGQGTAKQIEISQSDAAGNLSLSKLVFGVDTVAPSVATIQSLGGIDKVVSSSASDRVVRGTAEAGSKIELRSIAGTQRTPLASITVGTSGAYEYQLTSNNLAAIAQGVGKAMEVLSTDAAGNQSTSRPFNFAVEAKWNLGTTSNDNLSFSSGVDAITGLNGADRFVLPSLGSALVTGKSLLTFDHLLDYQIGVDQLDGPTAVAARNVTNLGRIQSLSDVGLSSLLTTQTFAANGAAVFTYQDMSDGLRTFVAFNDRLAGFKRDTDAVIEITGYGGVLSQLSII